MFVASGGNVAGLLKAVDPGAAAATTKSIFSAATAGMQAVTQLGEGSTAIASASYQRNAEHKLADKKELEAFISNLNLTMEEGREAIKKLSEQIQDGALLVSKIIRGNHESVLQTIQNLSKRTA